VRSWKVGELAKRTGLTVRTLHHYDEIGLLSPSRRTRAGHRVYGESEVERLQRIVSLRQLGLGLEEVAAVLDGPEGTLGRVLDRQAAHIRERIRLETELVDRLEAATRWLRSAGTVSVESMLELMEVMMNVESYYSPEQLAYLKRRREELGEDVIRSAEAEWPQLIAKMKEAMERGADPSSPEVQALAQRWGELVNAFTGGHAGVTESLRRMYAEKMEASGGFMGIDASLMEYVGRAMRPSGPAGE